MVMYPNNPADLERFRSALPNVGPTVLPKAAPKVTPPSLISTLSRRLLPPHVQKYVPAPMTPPVAAPQPAATPAAAASPAGALPPAQQLYNFLKGDLQRESLKEKGAAITDASNRGVFYGQPLTAMGQDIDERYQRGLAALQASLIQNEQQNELERMRIALSSLGPVPQAETPAFPADAFANLAAAFMPQSGAAPVTPATQTPPSYRRVGGKIVQTPPPQRID